MPRNARHEGLSRRHRFTARGSFGPVLRGSRKYRGRLTIVHAAPASTMASRLGVALTRKLVPEATDRNRIKRVAREIFRRHAVKHGGFDCVISLRERYEAGHIAALRAEITRSFDQLATHVPQR